MVRSIRRRRSKPPQITWEIGVYPASDAPGENAFVVLFTTNASVLSAQVCGPGEIGDVVERTAHKLALRSRPSRVVSNSVDALMRFDPPLTEETGELLDELPNADGLLKQARASLAGKTPAFFWMPVAAWEQDLADAIYDLAMSRVGLTFGANDVIRFASDDRELSVIGAVCVGENVPILAFATNEADLIALTGWSDPGQSPPAPTVTLEAVPAFGLDDVARAQAHAADVAPEIGAVPYVLNYPKANEAPSTGMISAERALDLLLCARAIVEMVDRSPSTLREAAGAYTTTEDEVTIRVTITRDAESTLPAVPAWLEAVEEPPEDVGELLQCRVENGAGEWRTFLLNSGVTLHHLAVACGAALSVLPEDDSEESGFDPVLSTAAGGLLAGYVEGAKENQVFMAMPAFEYPLSALLHLAGDGILVELADDVSGLMVTIDGVVHGERTVLMQLTGVSEEGDLEAERAAFDTFFDPDYDPEFDDDADDGMDVAYEYEDDDDDEGDSDPA